MDLVFLSVSSSLDNFIVGTSLGIADAALPVRLNLAVSAANALGAFVSAGAGSLLGSAAPLAAGFAAGGIFLYLAYGEADGFLRQEPSALSSLALKGVAWRLALPMTLNNIAGGVAGGIAKLGPFSMGIAAFFASFALMRLGHKVGKLSQGPVARRIDPRCAAALLFLALAVMQIHDAWREAQLCCQGAPKVVFSNHPRGQYTIIPTPPR